MPKSSLGRCLNQVHDLRLGPPTEPEVTVGPLAREDLRDAVERQVRGSVAQVGRILAGRPVHRWDPASSTSRQSSITSDRACRCSKRRYSVPPSPCCERVTVRAASLRLANDSNYGWGSAVWTADLERGEAFALSIEAGHTAVNGMTVSDPRLPFGGVKVLGLRPRALPSWSVRIRQLPHRGRQRC